MVQPGLPSLELGEACQDKEEVPDMPRLQACLWGQGQEMLGQYSA